GQASRIAVMMATATGGSHDGRCPLPRPCWRKCTCMTDAPASKAAFASRAISSGVTGTGCCLGSVSTPVSPQVMMALLDTGSRLALRKRQVDQQLAGGNLVAGPDGEARDTARRPCRHLMLHLHGLDDDEALAFFDGIALGHQHGHDLAVHGRAQLRF